jgi:hypothetical protein
MSEGRTEQTYEEIDHVRPQQDEGACQDPEEQRTVEGRISGWAEGFAWSPSIAERPEEAGGWGWGQRQEIEEWDGKEYGGERMGKGRQACDVHQVGVGEHGWSSC